MRLLMVWMVRSTVSRLSATSSAQGPIGQAVADLTSAAVAEHADGPPARPEPLPQASAVSGSRANAVAVSSILVDRAHLADRTWKMLRNP